MRRFFHLPVFALLPAVIPGLAGAHPGALDGNGCHCETASGRYHRHKDTKDLKPDPDVNAPAKKSREDLCHDKTSSNYKTIRSFVAYQSMAECVTSGGRPPG